MKIRMGFVSNSSSSSFCILGTSFVENSLKEKFKNTEFLQFEDENKDEVLELYKIGNNLTKDTDFDYTEGISEYVNELIIGHSIGEIENTKADKSINQIKAEMAEIMTKKWNIEIKPSDISFYIDGGYEG